MTKKIIKFYTILLIFLISLLFPSCSVRSLQKNTQAVMFNDFVNINGVSQYISIRGNNKNLPLLIFFHGGPGWSENTLLKKYNKDLEKHFIVIHWEQRGTGKSYFNGFESTISFDTLIKDSEEVVDYCLNRYKKDKVFIMGHSWGTILGIEYSDKHPEKVYAYIGVSQIFDLRKTIHISYKNLKNKINMESNFYQKFIMKLVDGEYKEKYYFEYMNYLRDVLTAEGMNIYEEHSYLGLGYPYLFDEEYNFFDLLNIFDGFKRTMTSMGVDSLNYNFDYKKKLKVPVFLAIGKKDGLIPFEIYQEILDSEHSDNYQYLIFEKSGHSPIFEESKKFNKNIIKIKEDIFFK